MVIKQDKEDQIENDKEDRRSIGRGTDKKKKRK